MAYRPKNTQERILHRLKISKGHLEKVVKMIEDDVYCIDVIHQMNAIERGLKETGNLVLENHLKGCVVDNIRKGDIETSVRELMEVFRKSNGKK